MFSWLGRSAKNARKNRGKIGEKRGAGKRNEALSVLYFAAPFLRTVPKLTGGLEETGRDLQPRSQGKDPGNEVGRPLGEERRGGRVGI